MQTHGNLGWRKLAKGAPVFEQQQVDADRSRLYKAKNLAARALGLSKSQIALLTSLISYFKEPINGMLLIWPSNEALQNATGYSERAVRGAIRELISLGVLHSKDSANGKRFAVRSKTQQIVDAYGFDLAPLLLREREFKEITRKIDADTEERKRQLDEITIARRQVQEVLRAFEDSEEGFDVRALEQRFIALAALTPRRSLIRAPELLLADWNDLKVEAEHQFHTAFAGKNCRHIENNNDISEQPCSNGNEKEEGRKSISLGDLRTACPDGVGYAGEMRTDGDLIGEAGRLRGAFGTHRSAWDEACEDLGRPRAAVTFFYVLQLFDDDQRGKRTITNFGGLFRATARKVANNEIDIVQEIHMMKRKRQH